MYKHKLLATLLAFLILLAFSTFVLAETSSNEVGKIAFISKRNGNEDIFVINDNGSDLLQLTDSDLIDEQPIWSPDGSKILYTSHKRALLNATYELWVVSVDGTRQTKIADSIDKKSIPQWSSDSSKILYVALDDKKRTIMLVNADGTEPFVLTTPELGGRYPTWSPDGTKILYAINGDDGNGLYLTNADGSDKYQLIKTDGICEEPTWSPKNGLIAYVYTKTLSSLFSRKSGVYLMEYDGSNDSYFAEGENITWCPDGITIGFIDEHTTYSEKQKSTTYTTYLKNIPSESKQKFLVSSTTGGITPYWSPDGLKVSYIDKKDVFVRISGDPEKYYFNVPLASQTPRWAPDSNKIVVVGHSKLFSKSSLYLVDFKSGKVTQLTEDTFDWEPVWSPVSYPVSTQ